MISRRIEIVLKSSFPPKSVEDRLLIWLWRQPAPHSYHLDLCGLGDLAINHSSVLRGAVPDGYHHLATRSLVDDLSRRFAAASVIEAKIVNQELFQSPCCIFRQEQPVANGLSIDPSRLHQL